LANFIDHWWRRVILNYYKYLLKNDNFFGIKFSQLYIELEIDSLKSTRKNDNGIVLTINNLLGS